MMLYCNCPRFTAEVRGECMGKDGKNAVRITTTLSKQRAIALEKVSKKYDVKVAWLVRKAVERLLDQEESGQPLMLTSHGEHKR